MNARTLAGGDELAERADERPRCVHRRRGRRPQQLHDGRVQRADGGAHAQRERFLHAAAESRAQLQRGLRAMQRARNCCPKRS